MQKQFKIKKYFSSKEFQYIKEREVSYNKIFPAIGSDFRLLKNSTSRVVFAPKLSAKLKNFLGSFFPASTPFPPLVVCNLYLAGADIYTRKSFTFGKSGNTRDN